MRLGVFLGTDNSCILAVGQMGCRTNWVLNHRSVGHPGRYHHENNKVERLLLMWTVGILGLTLDRNRINADSSVTFYISR